VLDGFDGDTPRLRAPASRATVHQLVTHTTGLGYWFFDENLAKWEAVTSTPNLLSGTNVVFTAPLLADPGTTYIYGINTDWLGKVVEAAGGVALDVAIKDGITGPLGMDETAFQIAEAWKDGGLTPVQAEVDGAWVDSGIELNQSPEYYTLLGGPQHRHLRVDLLPLPSVRHAGGLRALQPLRAGAVRGSVVAR
jgi:methyl acetate hydrolase